MCCHYTTAALWEKNCPLRNDIRRLQHCNQQDSSAIAANRFDTEPEAPSPRGKVVVISKVFDSQPLYSSGDQNNLRYFIAIRTTHATRQCRRRG